MPRRKASDKNAGKASEVQQTVETRGRKAKYDSLPEEIVCLNCQKKKNRNEFSSSQKMRGTGASSYCKECQVDINMLYRYKKLAAEDPQKLEEMRQDLKKRIKFIEQAQRETGATV